MCLLNFIRVKQEIETIYHSDRIFCGVANEMKKWIQECKDIDMFAQDTLKEVLDYELWKGYAKFRIVRDANITDIVDKFRGIEGITVVTSVEIVQTEEEEVHMVKFKFIKIGHWRDYYKFLKHVALFHPNPEKKIEGLKTIQFVRKPEQIL